MSADLEKPQKSVDNTTLNPQVQTSTDLPYHVIGSGVVGLVTAYYLNKKGIKVEVIDSNQKPCHGTSFANGGLVCQTSFSTSPPLFSLIDPNDLNTKITMKALDVNFLRFGISYLKMRMKSALGLSLSFRKQDYLAESVELFDEDFRQQKDFSEAGAYFEKPFHAPLGRISVHSEVRHRNWLEKLDKYPKMQYKVIDKVAELQHGNLIDHDTIELNCDYIVESETFGKRVCSYLERKGVKFRYSTELSGFEAQGNKISELLLTKDDKTEKIKTRGVVLATGPNSSSILRKFGYGNIPIIPMQGHSITYEITENDRKYLPKNVPCIQDGQIVHSYFSIFENSYRSSAFGDFVGFDTEVNVDRVKLLDDVWKKVMPKLDFNNAVAWAGLRPVSADMHPVIGRDEKRGFKNVYLNVGHGTLGFSYAFFAGKMVSDAVVRDVLSPQQTIVTRGSENGEINPFCPSRFRFFE